MPILTREIAGSVIDYKNTNSVIDPFVAYCVDQQGCGEFTHAKYRTAAQYKTRTQCQPAFDVAGLSISGYRNLETGNAKLAANLLLDTMIAYNSNRNFNPTDYQFRGTEWVFENPGTELISISIPRKTDRLDQCDRIVGTNLSASINIYRYDPDTCRPYLRDQVSIKAFHAGDFADYKAIFGFGGGANSAQIDTQLDLLGTLSCTEPRATTDAALTLFTLPYQWGVVNDPNVAN